MTRLFTRSLPAVLLLGLAACGHDAVIRGRVSSGGGEVPVITGGVLAPFATFAMQSRSRHWLSDAFVPPALALGPEVQPIQGQSVVVALLRVGAEDAADGAIDSPRSISASTTNEDGRFALPLLGGAAVGDCGLLIRAREGNVQMRAFVYRDDQDLSAVSEAVVRRILSHLVTHPGRDLCNFSVAELAALTDLVASLSRDQSGITVEDLNRVVELIEARSPAVNQLLEEAARF